MNIKEAEQATGISRQNIRFYEKEGLLTPTRNRENAYREYGPQDLRILKLVRLLRMLDLPLEEVRAVLEEELSLSDAVGRQQKRLEIQAQELVAAAQFCGSLAERKQGVAELDVDNCLAQLDQTQTQGGFAMKWLEDYRKVARSEHARVFSFEPEEDPTTARAFTDLLLAYGKQHDLDLVLTQEGMEPVFTVDGVEYRAMRLYHYMRGIPVPSVRCEMTHPEQSQPDLPAGRLRWLRRLHWWLPGLVVAVLVALFFGLAGGGILLTTPVGWIAVIGLGLVALGQSYYYTQIHYNDNGSPRRKGGKADKHK